MHVERLLQINVATLAAMSTFLVGMGQEDAILPLAMLAAAMVSVWVTDIAGVFHLNRTAARIAEIGALVVAIPGAMRLEKHAMISSVGTFLMCLQVIQLFQKKDNRVYTLLLRLSLLQVVVGTLLNQGFHFGAMLVAYLFTALSALFLLFLHSERQKYAWGEGRARITTHRTRWPLAGQQASLLCPSTGRARVEPEMFYRLFNVGAVTLAISVLVFFTIPRFGHGAWRGARFAASGSVGFSEQVTLGELGQIIQNPEEVVRVSFFDAATGQPYLAPKDVYLRGVVLVDYEQRQWRAWPHSERVMPRMGLFQAGPPTEVVRQQIVPQPSAGPDLFCVWPVIFPLTDNRIIYSPEYDRLFRRMDQVTQEPYELWTTAFDQGEQCVIVPSDVRVEVRRLLQMDPEAMPGLVALAEQWDKRIRLARDDHFSRDRNLERMLRDSGQFQYSLEGQPRDSGLDPVEDFVKNNPRGHCEYFASALALMLRSQGIPARIVVGFRSDEWNEVGEPFLQVRQMHAHSWVEAFLDWDHLPPELRKDPNVWGRGAWLRLDATPEARDEAAVNFWSRGPGKYFDWLDFAWARYVMEMDRPRQHQAIYGPLATFLQDAARAIIDPDWWRGLFAQVRKALGLDRLHQPGGPWFHWRAFLAVIVSGVVLLAGAAGGRLLWKRRAAAAQGKRLTRRRDWVKIEFYRRLEAVLARAGLVRPVSHTQREFAQEAGHRLAEQSGDAQLAPLPLQIVEAFYRVRFGQVLLDNSQSEAVEQALVRLEGALEKSRQ